MLADTATLMRAVGPLLDVADRMMAALVTGNEVAAHVAALDYQSLRDEWRRQPGEPGILGVR